MKKYMVKMSPNGDFRGEERVHSQRQTMSGRQDWESTILAVASVMMPHTQSDLLNGG